MPKLRQVNAIPLNVYPTVRTVLLPTLAYSAHLDTISPTLLHVILRIQLLLLAQLLFKAKIVLLAKIYPMQLCAFNAVGVFSLQSTYPLAFLKYAMFLIAKFVSRTVSWAMGFKYALYVNKDTHWTLTCSAYHWVQFYQHPIVVAFIIAYFVGMITIVIIVLQIGMLQTGYA